MSISPDLFMAILAMDFYNRGIGAGVNVEGNQIGNAALLSVELPSGSQTATFSAQAYIWNSQTARRAE